MWMVTWYSQFELGMVTGVRVMLLYPVVYSPSVHATNTGVQPYPPNVFLLATMFWNICVGFYVMCIFPMPLLKIRPTLLMLSQFGKLCMNLDFTLWTKASDWHCLRGFHFIRSCCKIYIKVLLDFWKDKYIHSTIFLRV